MAFTSELFIQCILGNNLGTWGNLMRTPWEHDGNTLGAREKTKNPSTSLGH
jgi:hypothetical protein